MRILRSLYVRVRSAFIFHNSNAPIMMVEGLFASMVYYLTYPFYQLFANAMGATDTAIGMINALPALFSVILLLPISSYVDQLERKKPFVLLMITFCGGLLPLIALSPYLGSMSYWVFIFAISVWNIPYYCYNASWQSYFSDLFSPRERSMPYALRNTANNIAAGFCTVAGGLVLAYLCRTPGQKLMGYQAFFVLAGVLAIFQYRMMKRTEPPTSSEHVREYRKVRFTPLKAYRTALSAIRENRRYRLFLLGLFITYFLWQFGWPLFFIYLVKTNGYGEMAKLSLDATSYICLAVGSVFWGRLMQRMDLRIASAIGMFGCALAPIWTVLCKDMLWMMYINYAVTGMLQPAFQMGMFQQMLQVIPEENRTLNIGVYNTMMQFSGFVAPLLGVAVSNHWGAEFAMEMSALLRGLGSITLILLFFIQRGRDKQPSAPSAAG